MVSKSPKLGLFPFQKWLVNGGHELLDLTGMILQVTVANEGLGRESRS